MKRYIALFGVLVIMGCSSSGLDQDAFQQDQITTEGVIRTARSSLKRDENPQVTADDKTTLARDNTAFAFGLYAKLVGNDPKKNLFISPYSISSALAMTFAGARGDTATQMSSVMHFNLPEDRLHPAFNALDLVLESRGSESVDKGKPFELSIANALWGQTGFPFEQAFLDLLAKNYGAGMMLVDFIHATESARLAINAWVEEQTHQRIKDLLGPGTITADTRLVLTNTIYFNAGWLDKFKKDLTHSEPFYPLDSTKINVDMMHMDQSLDLPYTKTSEFQAVALPYVGEKVEMVVILPKAGRFNAVESGLTGQKFMEILADMKLSMGKVSMPAFGMEYKASLGKPLQDMGMTTAFSSNADFTGMTKQGGLAISDVIHQTFLKVDEEGTEAAGATAVVMVGTSVPVDPPFEMIVNRPFIFAIVDRPTGAVLFLGRVLSPGSAN